MKISKVVASFGRYPDRRPPGLRVCPDGAIRVQDIVDSWGAGRGISRQQLVTALQEHMFHSDGGRSLRFALSEDAEGHLIVRVMAKRSKDYRGHRQSHQQVSPFATACPAKSPQIASAPWRVAKEANKGQRSAYQVDSPPLAPTASTLSGPATALSTSEKLDLSLDDLLRADGGHVHSRRSRLPEVDLVRPDWSRNRVMEVERPRRTRSEEASSASPRRSRLATRTEEVQVGQVIAEAEMGPEQGRKPAPPPGDHWQEYRDDGVGSWWHYDGPMGKFVCTGKDKQVLAVES